MRKLVEKLVDWELGDWVPHLVAIGLSALCARCPVVATVARTIFADHERPAVVTVDDALSANPDVFRAHHNAR